MLFNSWGFLFGFLPATLLLSLVFRKYETGAYYKVFLSAVSLLFLHLNDANSVLILALSVVMNFLFVRYLPLRFVALPVVVNLILLAAFKYLKLWSFNSGFAIPLGISFYTFQQIGYIIDCSQSKSRRLSLKDYVLYMTFFPKLLAGPILQSDELVRKPDTLAQFNQGLFVFAIGLFKKVVIADHLLVNFSASGDGFVSAWVSGCFLMFHLYFDFGGYSDMAVGLAKMFGFEIPWNFHAPFKSKSLIEFWNRWHISLGNFVRTYFFTWQIRKYAGHFGAQMVVLFLTMVLLGVWHGATLNYLLFGVLHGAGLVCNYWFRRAKLNLATGAAQALTFLFVLFTMVIFCSPEFKEALINVKAMLNVARISVADFKENIAVISLLASILALAFKAPSSKDLTESFRPSFKTVAFAFALLLLSILNLNLETPFVYMGY